MKFFSGSGKIPWYPGTEFKLIFTRVFTERRGGAAANFFQDLVKFLCFPGTEFKLLFTRVLIH